MSSSSHTVVEQKVRSESSPANPRLLLTMQIRTGDYMASRPRTGIGGSKQEELRRAR